MDDFLMDPVTGELVWKNGDLDFGDSTKQNQKYLLIANKNDYKQSPTVGVAILTAINDEDKNDLFRNIRIEMVKDGMTIDDLKILDNGNIGLNAHYK